MISRRPVLTTGDCQALCDGMHAFRAACGDANMKAIPATANFIKTRTGVRVGYTPACGLSKAKNAVTYLELVKEEPGDRWTPPDLCRFDASSLPGDIERQIERDVTGAYSASWRHPLA